MRQLPGVLITLCLLVLTACGGGSGVKPEARRPAPVAPGDDAPRSKYGNPESYEVYGKTYHVLPTARGYSERGQASWYGEDFHGKRTSSGEPYNMHAMTAAHKTLPLPTYVRVTNLQNRREVIVRVNDRGPFHDDRIIDLSFAAATELDILRNGTAEVEVTTVDPVRAAANLEPPRRANPEPAHKDPVVAATQRPRASTEAPGDVLAPDEIPVGATAPALDAEEDTAPIVVELPADEPAPPVTPTRPDTRVAAAAAPASPQGHYLQVGAFSEAKNAEAMVTRLRRAGFDTTAVYPTRGILKVRLGPYPSAAAMRDDEARLVQLGIRPYPVEE